MPIYGPYMPIYSIYAIYAHIWTISSKSSSHLGSLSSGVSHCGVIGGNSKAGGTHPLKKSFHMYRLLISGEYLWGVAMSSLDPNTTIGVLSTAPWKPGERGSYTNRTCATLNKVTPQWNLHNSLQRCVIISSTFLHSNRCPGNIFGDRSEMTHALLL